MNHPEDFCELCRGVNITWFAPNDLWNKVTKREYDILCITCFTRIAEDAGIVPTAWMLSAEDLSISGERRERRVAGQSK